MAKIYTVLAHLKPFTDAEPSPLPGPVTIQHAKTGLTKTQARSTARRWMKEGIEIHRPIGPESEYLFYPPRMILRVQVDEVHPVTPRRGR